MLLQSTLKSATAAMDILDMVMVYDGNRGQILTSKAQRRLPAVLWAPL